MEVCSIVRVSLDFASVVYLGDNDCERKFYCCRRSFIYGRCLDIRVGVSGFAAEITSWISLSRAYGSGAAIYYSRTDMHSLRRVSLVPMIVGLLSFSRHPELVSGPISPRSQAVIGAGWMLKRVEHDGNDVKSVAYRGKSKINRKINPLRIFRFNQIDLPWTVPVFQLFLARDRAGHVVEHFKADKQIYRILRRISGRQIVAVLVQALDQVRGYADVKRAVGLAGEYVDARLFRLSHGRYMGAPWTLKQVQGDGLGGIGRY